jgi:hypothetical protein
MTKDEIIKLSGAIVYRDENDMEYVYLDDALDITKLVAAKEREACAKVCEDGLNIATSLQALDDMEIWGEKFAKAIRARGEA